MKKLIAIYLVTICLITNGQNLNISNGVVFDGEPFIALNPNNNQHLVVAWMGFQLGQKVVIKTKASFDGGVTWSATSNLPHIISTNGSADPSLYFDNDGNVYLCYIDFDNDNFDNGVVVVSKSTDGINWDTPVVAIDIEDCPDKLCVDRPWMVIDRSGGALDGTIYVTSMTPDNPTVVAPFHPFLTRSFDEGQTFEPLRYLDTVDFLVGNEIQQPMPTPAVSANGTFHAIYPAYVQSQSLFPQYIHVSSIDGGNTLSHNIQETVMQSTGFQQYPDAKKAPLLISNPSDENHLLYVFLRIDGDDFNVYFSESFDAGTNWTAKQKANDNPTGGAIVHDLVWASFNEAGDFVISWRDRRNGGPGFNVDSEIRGAVKYLDSALISSNFLISDALIEHDQILANSGNDFMCIEYVGDTVHAVWGDVRTGTINIFYNKLIVSQQTSNIKSISEEDWRFKVLYPNPAKETINIDEELTGSTFIVFNEQGQKVRTGRIEKSQINVVGLDQGQYFLVVKNKKGEYGFRFLKEQ